MYFLLHAHGRVRAVHDELVGVVEMCAQVLRSVVILTRGRVDKTLVTLKGRLAWNILP